MVTMTKEGEFHVDSQKYDLDGAIAELNAIHTADPYKRLALRADAGLTYKAVRDVFFRLQEVGFPGTSLMVSHRYQAGKESAGAPPAAAQPAAAAPADASGARATEMLRPRRHGGGPPAPTARPARERRCAVGGSPRARGIRGAVQPDMNVTPLVDVVLVLLIIFIVITPQLTKKFWVHTPKQEKKEVEKQDLTQDPSPPLVLRVTAQKTLNVNGTEIALAELPDRLRRMVAARGDDTLVAEGEDEGRYSFAVEVMDQAAGGAVTIAPLIAETRPNADAPPARQ
jgi:biopolymer transport protein ExbD/biopolymer transport protein TolR